MVWRCNVCSHKTQSIEPPASCPHCGQPGTEMSAEDNPQDQPSPPQNPVDSQVMPGLRLRTGIRRIRPAVERPSESVDLPVFWA